MCITKHDDCLCYKFKHTIPTREDHIKCNKYYEEDINNSKNFRDLQ